MSKITESARGEQCLIRIPGVCNRQDETTVACHEPCGSGLSMKWPDTEIAYGCSACHDEIDGRTRYKPQGHAVYTLNDLLMMFYQGARRTRQKLIDKGLLVMP
jgi:hypothetical protein